MTTEEAKVILPIIKAYSEGKTIQVYSSIKMEWTDIEDPAFNCSPVEYRIKPEPIYKPYDVKTLAGSIKSHGNLVKRKDAEEYVIIGSWNPYGFYFAWQDDASSYSVLLEDWVWADDDSPCGVLTDNNE